MDTKQMAEDMLKQLCQLIQGPGKRLQGMSGGEMGTLMFMAGQAEPVTPTAISREFGVTTARTANVLNSLERKGYVHRSHASDDRRRVLVELTETGWSLVQQCRRSTLEQMTRLLDLLGDEDAAEMYRLMGRVMQVCKACEPMTLEIKEGVHT